MVFSLALILSLVAVPTGAGHGRPFELLFTRDEVAVWRRLDANTSLVDFRGQGVVAAPIDAVLAVLVDIERSEEWLVMCRENKLIEERRLGHNLSYNRTASPTALVSDRDAVVRAETQMQPQHRAVRYAFAGIDDPRRPPVAGVVRVPALEGFWHLTQLEPARTAVIYQVRADPGGAIPAWLANWGARDVPYRSIRSLQQRLRAGIDADLQRRVRDQLDWSGFNLTSTTGGWTGQASALHKRGT